MAKEAKVVNFGITDETMNYLDEMVKKMNEKEREESKANAKEKPEDKAKKMICDTVEAEIEKLNKKLKELSPEDVGNDVWMNLMNGLDRARDIIAYL